MIELNRKTTILRFITNGSGGIGDSDVGVVQKGVSVDFTGNFLNTGDDGYLYLDFIVESGVPVTLTISSVYSAVILGSTNDVASYGEMTFTPRGEKIEFILDQV